MTIRRTLLGAFLIVSLTPGVILTYLAFVQTRQALQQEIQATLQSQAATVASELDHLLFERQRNVLSWSRLEVMQDLKIGDVDKRLSQFLAELRNAYGDLYIDLYCTSPTGQAIAASRPEMIGRSIPPVTPWSTTALPGGTVILGLPGPYLGNGRSSLPIVTAVTSSTDGTPLGNLVLQFNWQQIEKILDNAASGGSSIAILDDQGNILARSADLRRHPDLLRQLPRLRARILGLEAPPAPAGPSLMFGYQPSQGSDPFAGSRWTTVVFQTGTKALAPIRQMQLSFVILLTATSFLTSAFAVFVAARIARPITALTAFTRRVAREKRLPEEIPSGRGEVGELAHAFVGMVRDLDRSRQDFLRASRLAVAGEFAATIAHEIRTPLGILRSSAQVLRQEPALSAEGRELVGYVESETERINRLVSGLLESANPRPPVFSPHDISNIVHACIVMLMPQAEQKHIAVEQGDMAGNLVIDCDVEQLIQVILNLMLNAIQLLPERGRIAVHCIDEHQRVKIEVADDGPGIPPGDRAHVFEPFFSKRRGGLGLGLSVAHQIVSAHRGQILVGESRWGGALFSILLPRHASE